MKKITVVKEDESVWDETPTRKWFEDPKVMEEEEMTTVKVPLLYMILSRLRVRRPKALSLKPEFQTEKVDDDEIWSD